MVIQDEPAAARNRRLIAEGVSDLEGLHLVSEEESRLARERAEAAQVAARFGLEVADLENFRIDNDLFRHIPFDLMLRYGFIPERQLEGRLAVVIADPTDVVKLDELELQLGQPLEARVGARIEIEDLLQKSESAQRVLDEATEDFKIQLVQEDEDSGEVLSIDRISSDQSPIIKLVDSTLFNAIQRRASDIHIETREHEVIISTASTGCCTRQWNRSTAATTRPSSAGSRSCRNSTSPRSGSRRTGVSRSGSAVARSTSGSP